MFKEKKELTILQKRNRIKRINTALKVGTYTLPIIPAIIDLGVNYNDWFAQGGASVPMGFALLMVSLLTSLFIILKNDTEFTKKLSPLLFASIIMVLLGASFMALASIGTELGKMFLYTASGLLGSFTTDQVRNSIMNKKLKYYQDLVDKYDLDDSKKQKKIRLEKKQAELEAKAKEEAEKEPVE